MKTPCLKPVSRPSNAAFTLVELLVVIAIMGVLAGMIVWGADIAIQKGKLSRVQTELKYVETAIENYKSKMGFYPPDNTNDPATSPLFYELSGCLTGNSSYTNNINGREYPLPKAVIQSQFKRDGFQNANADPSEVHNFFSGGLEAKRYADIGGGVFVLAVPADGPVYKPNGGAVVSGVNPWRYRSSNPEGNPGGFDLWAEIVHRGKTSVIKNWKGKEK